MSQSLQQQTPQQYLIQQQQQQGNNNNLLLLPAGYTPSDLDIVSGRGKKNWHHAGNVAFRNHIQSNVGRYMSAPSKTDKTEIVQSIVDELRDRGCLFLKKDTKSGHWLDIGVNGARDKVGHALRDQVTAISKQQQKQQEENNNNNNNKTADDHINTIQSNHEDVITIKTKKMSLQPQPYPSISPKDFVGRGSEMRRSSVLAGALVEALSGNTEVMGNRRWSLMKELSQDNIISRKSSIFSSFHGGGDGDGDGTRRLSELSELSWMMETDDVVKHGNKSYMMKGIIDSFSTTSSPLEIDDAVVKHRNRNLMMKGVIESFSTVGSPSCETAADDVKHHPNNKKLLMKGAIDSFSTTSAMTSPSSSFRRSSIFHNFPRCLPDKPTSSRSTLDDPIPEQEEEEQQHPAAAAAAVYDEAAARSSRSIMSGSTAALQFLGEGLGDILQYYNEDEIPKLEQHDDVVVLQQPSRIGSSNSLSFKDLDMRRSNNNVAPRLSLVDPLFFHEHYHHHHHHKIEETGAEPSTAGRDTTSSRMSWVQTFDDGTMMEIKGFDEPQPLVPSTSLANGMSNNNNGHYVYGGEFSGTTNGTTMASTTCGDGGSTSRANWQPQQQQQQHQQHSSGFRRSIMFDDVEHMAGV